MNLLSRVSFVIVVAGCAAILTWPNAVELLFPVSPPMHRPGTEPIPLGIAFLTWAGVCTVGLRVLLLRIPRSWHVGARAASFVAVAIVLLSVGQASLLAPLSALHFSCVTAHLCQVSALADDVYTTFSVLAYRSPLPELAVVVPVLMLAAWALRRAEDRPSDQRPMPPSATRLQR